MPNIKRKARVEQVSILSLVSFIINFIIIHIRLIKYDNLLNILIDHIIEHKK